jgi:hypothetical protein
MRLARVCLLGRVFVGLWRPEKREGKRQKWRRRARGTVGLGFVRCG